MSEAPRPFTFQAVLELHGRTATGIRVPVEVVEGLGGGKRAAVRVTINNHTYRSSVAVMCGEFMLGVSAEQRALAGVAAGDRVDVELKLDTEPREVTVPEDLAAALAADDGARHFFETLSYSKRLRYALSVETAKKPETRQLRVAAALSALRAGRPLG